MALKKLNQMIMSKINTLKRMERSDSDSQANPAKTVPHLEWQFMKRKDF